MWRARAVGGWRRPAAAGLPFDGPQMVARCCLTTSTTAAAVNTVGDDRWCCLRQLQLSYIHIDTDRSMLLVRHSNWMQHSPTASKVLFPTARLLWLQIEWAHLRMRSRGCPQTNLATCVGRPVKATVASLFPCYLSSCRQLQLRVVASSIPST